VSDGRSSDATGAIAQAWGGQVVDGAPSRGGQLRRGCAAAKGRWLLVLHADTVLAPGWSGPVSEHLGTDCAGWFRLAFDGGGMPARIVAGWANARSRFGLPYGDQGLLVPRAMYDAVGGYCDQPLMEDVAMARALKGKLRQINAVAITSAEKYRAQGWLRRGGKNLWTLIQYAAGTPPDKLAKVYRR